MLDAKKFSSGKPDRAVFLRRDASGRTVKEPVIAESLMMHEQGRAVNACNTHLVYITVSLCSLICNLRSFPSLL